MTFQPVVPLGGFVGWSFLQRTEEAQRDAFEKSPLIERETDYFVENINSIQTAEELVADRQLLKVALGAFGLQDDLPNRAFVQKILEGGVLSEDSLANRLSDSRYYEFAKAFGFDLGTPNTVLTSFPDEIVALYQERQFEVAIGNQSEEMRLALGLRRDLVEIANDDVAEDTKWFRMMGNAPLRAVFETALGLPPSFGSIDLEQQLQVFKDRTQSAFGEDTISQFSDEESLEPLVRRFFALGEIGNLQSGSFSGSNVALTLLQSNPIAPLA